MDETELRTRLAALEMRAPSAEPPPVRALGHHRRWPLSVATAPLLVLALVATATAGTLAVTGRLAQGHPGVENPGQPLAGAGLECMSPPGAARYLAAHGFTRVIWQIERDGADPTTLQQSTAPEHGYVVPGALIDGTLYMVVDQRPGATGVGACFGRPMP